MKNRILAAVAAVRLSGAIAPAGGEMSGLNPAIAGNPRVPA